MIKNKIQRLEEFEMLQGEFLTININCKKQDGKDIDVSSFVATLEVFQYGDREMAISTITGAKVDSNKISFKISSSDTQEWYGKLEYIISLDYSNGDKNKGLGYITIM